jgi:hypothetical protein
MIFKKQMAITTDQAKRLESSKSFSTPKGNLFIIKALDWCGRGEWGNLKKNIFQDK